MIIIILGSSGSQSFIFIFIFSLEPWKMILRLWEKSSFNMLYCLVLFSQPMFYE